MKKNSSLHYIHVLPPLQKLVVSYAANTVCTISCEENQQQNICSICQRLFHLNKCGTQERITTYRGISLFLKPTNGGHFKVALWVPCVFLLNSSIKLGTKIKQVLQYLNMFCYTNLPNVTSCKISLKLF